MNQDKVYRVTNRRIAHEKIDGEVIVIHFDSGNYYSMDGTAVQVWDWLVGGATRGQIVHSFDNLHAGQAANIDEFLATLVEEEMIEKIDDESPSTDRLPGAPAPFTELKYAKYNDMQKLLLSDPIHDVDEMGWPNLETEKKEAQA